MLGLNLDKNIKYIIYGIVALIGGYVFIKYAYPRIKGLSTT